MRNAARLAAIIVGTTIFVWAVYFAIAPAKATLLFQRLVEYSIPWNSKLAAAKCAGTLAGWNSWPRAPKKACQAMSMCLNEAELTGEQRDKLAKMMRSAPNCYDP